MTQMRMLLKRLIYLSQKDRLGLAVGLAALRRPIYCLSYFLRNAELASKWRTEKTQVHAASKAAF